MSKSEAVVIESIEVRELLHFLFYLDILNKLSLLQRKHSKYMYAKCLNFSCFITYLAACMHAFCMFYLYVSLGNCFGNVHSVVETNKATTPFKEKCFIFFSDPIGQWDSNEKVIESRSLLTLTLMEILKQFQSTQEQSYYDNAFSFQLKSIVKLPYFDKI